MFLLHFNHVFLQLFHGGVDGFREFVFQSTFLKRYKVKKDVLRKIKTDDVSLMKFGFAWVKFVVWGMKSPYFKPR